VSHRPPGSCTHTPGGIHPDPTTTPTPKKAELEELAYIVGCNLVVEFVPKDSKYKIEYVPEDKKGSKNAKISGLRRAI